MQMLIVAFERKVSGFRWKKEDIVVCVKQLNRSSQNLRSDLTEKEHILERIRNCV